MRACARYNGIVVYVWYIMPTMTSIATPTAAFQCWTMIARRSNKWTLGSALNNPAVFRLWTFDAGSGDGVPVVGPVGVRPPEANILVSGGGHARQLRGRSRRNVVARCERTGIGQAR